MSRTSKCPGALMVETLVNFNIICNWQVEGLSMGNNPVQYCPFQAFSVIGLSTRDTFLKLLGSISRGFHRTRGIKYQFSNFSGFRHFSAENTFFESRDHLKKFIEHVMLPPLPVRQLFECDNARCEVQAKVSGLHSCK